MIKFEKYRIELNALQNPLACYNRLHPYKVGEKEISPRFCRDILSATDNPKVVTELLELVSQKLEDAPEKYAEYRPMLIGSLLERRHAEKISPKIRKIQARNIVSDAVATNASPEDYFLFLLSSNNTEEKQPLEIIRLKEKLIARDIANIRNYCQSIIVRKMQEAAFQKMEVSAENVKKVFCTPYNELETELCVKNADFAPYAGLYIKTAPQTKTLKFDSCKNIPQCNNIHECGGIKNFNLRNMDYGHKILRLPETVSDIYLENCRNFSQNIDFSNLPNLWRVVLDNSDFQGVDNIYFPQGGKIGLLSLNNIAHFPENFDLSAFCSVGYLSADGSFFARNRMLPEKVSTIVVNRYRNSSRMLDFSSVTEAKEVRFVLSNLEYLQQIKFPEKVERIVFEECVGLPEKLDLNIPGLENVTFRRSDNYGTLRELFLPPEMKGRPVDAVLQNSKVKIYYGAKPVSTAARIFNRIKEKIGR